MGPSCTTIEPGYMCKNITSRKCKGQVQHQHELKQNAAKHATKTKTLPSLTRSGSSWALLECISVAIKGTCNNKGLVQFCHLHQKLHMCCFDLVSGGVCSMILLHPTPTCANASLDIFTLLFSFHNGCKYLTSLNSPRAHIIKLRNTFVQNKCMNQ